MRKRGPQAPGEFSSKGATLSARITVGTRQRLEKAAKASGRSLSQEVEARLAHSLYDGQSTDRELFWLIGKVIERTVRFTGQDWGKDAYTFHLMVEAVRLLLAKFRPKGKLAMPDTIQLLRGLQGAADLQEEMRSVFQRHPPEYFADMVVNGVIADLRIVVEKSPEKGVEPYRRAAEFLVGPLTDPVLQPVKDANTPQPKGGSSK